MTVKRLFLTLALLAAGTAAQAQVTIRCVVVNPEGEPLPFATVYCLNTQDGVSANFKGEVSIGVKAPSNVLVFSALGHQDLKLTAEKAALQETVTLARQVYVLPPVVIQSNVPYRSLLNTEALKLFFGPKMWRSVAVKIVAPLEAGKLLSKVEFRQHRKEIYNIQYAPHVYLRIFAIGPDGLPGADLLTDRVELPVRPYVEKVSVNVARYGIIIPRQGIFVGFEWVPRNEHNYNDQKEYRKLADNIWPMITLTNDIKDDLTAYKLNPGAPWMLREEYCRQIDALAGHYRNIMHNEVKSAYPDFNPMIGVKLKKAPHRLTK